MSYRFPSPSQNYVHTHQKYNPLTGEISATSTNEYEINRNHPERPHKDRNNAFDGDITVEALQPNDDRRYTYLLDPTKEQLFKAIGYDDDRNYPEKTGTSRENVPCVTDGMGVCIAVAVGAQKILADSRPEAKVAIFHVSPFNRNAANAVENYVENLQSNRFAVKVAMHGGFNRVIDSDTGATDIEFYERISNRKAEELRGVCDRKRVLVEFDETCQNRHDQTLLGAVNINGTPRFFKRIALDPRLGAADQSYDTSRSTSTYPSTPYGNTSSYTTPPLLGDIYGASASTSTYPSTPYRNPGSYTTPALPNNPYGAFASTSSYPVTPYGNTSSYGAHASAQREYFDYVNGYYRNTTTGRATRYGTPGTERDPALYNR